jgi:hypothetical protein
LNQWIAAELSHPLKKNEMVLPKKNFEKKISFPKKCVEVWVFDGTALCRAHRLYLERPYLERPYIEATISQTNLRRNAKKWALHTGLSIHFANLLGATFFYKNKNKCWIQIRMEVKLNTN